jgi:hypothetical protein
MNIRVSSEHNYAAVNSLKILTEQLSRNVKLFLRIEEADWPRKFYTRIQVFCLKSWIINYTRHEREIVYYLYVTIFQYLYLYFTMIMVKGLAEPYRTVNKQILLYI